MKYTEQDMLKLIADVESEFKAHLAKAESMEGLNKAEDKDEDDKKKKEEDEKDEDDKKEDLEKSHDDEDDKSDDDDEDEDDYDDEDKEEMHKMYKGMKKSELSAHFASAQKAMETKGLYKAETMAKSESNPELELTKSELATLKKENEELKKHSEAIQSFLKVFNEKAPKQKAITSLDYLKKGEESEEKSLSKSEIHKVLLTKSQDPSLSKSDRDAINSYYTNDQRSVDLIKHLLK